MTALALVVGSDLDAPLAWRAGRPISRRQYLADVAALAERLPAHGSMLSLTGDRYRFAVGLGAAMLRGHTSLLPPNHTDDMIRRLRELYADIYCVVDPGAAPNGLPMVEHLPAHRQGDAPGAPSAPADAVRTAARVHVASASSSSTDVPQIDADLIAARVLTSGSTGAPLPHAKPWALLVASAQAEAARLAESIGRASLEGVALVATVPAQHMYGFESTVLIALQGGAAFDAERPFYPADIAAALDRLPRPRLLVTTPFHLKMLLDTRVALPAVDLALSATAPLAPQLAARAEAALGAPLMEIYGCTEAGQVATRRTTAGAEWRTFDALRLHGDADRTTVVGGHVPQPTVLADVLEVIDPQRFRLLGRSNDLVNIAGKRSSLSHLNFHLNAIDGVTDGAFWMPPESGTEPEVTRLVAFVVAPDRANAGILAALRERIDPAFLPRRIIRVARLPRDPTGKLPADRLAALAGRAAAPHRDVAQSRSPTSNAVAPDIAIDNIATRLPAAVPCAPSAVALRISADHPAFAGHFPGRPLVPGVTLLAEVLEAVLADPDLAAAVGPAPRLSVAKFLAPLSPGAELSLRFERTPTALRFEVLHGERIAASGQFERVSQ